MNYHILRQMRIGISQVINQNKTTIMINRLPLKDNGLGEMLPDPFGTPVDYYVRCRISHEKRYPETLSQANHGFSTNQQMYILCDYAQGIFYLDDFEYAGRRYEIGPINYVMYFGKVVSYEAPLKEIPVSESST